MQIHSNCGQHLSFSMMMVMMMVMMMIMKAIAMAMAMAMVMAMANCFWLKPRALRRALARQGLSGPAPAFMTGNYSEIMKLESLAISQDMPSLSHDILRRMLPYYTKWKQIYGKRFVFWEALEPRVVVTEPELIREVFSARWALAFGKSPIHQRCCEHFLGRGLVMANGHDWARQRRAIAPAFHLERVKGLAGVMGKCTEAMLETWEKLIGDRAEAAVDVHSHLRVLTADIIACTEFGSSYDKGKRIFDLLTSLQKLTLRFAHFVWLPGSRFLPTTWNLEIWRLKREMGNLMKEIIQERRDSVRIGRMESYGKDLLGLMLAESEEAKEEEEGKQLSDLGIEEPGADAGRSRLSMEQIMDECKTFFFAGHETSAGLLTWSLLLLASNPEWQDKARAEVVEVLGGQGRIDPPEADALHKLKILGMVINETLRLYPPAIVVTRYALTDVQLGEVTIPKDASVWVPVLGLHLDEELWGSDAREFRPQRFEHGVARACRHPLAFLPFALGPRNCIGHAFALMETKIILSIILARFRFTPSPAYRHAPVTLLTLRPKHGAPLILHRLLSD